MPRKPSDSPDVDDYWGEDMLDNFDPIPEEIPEDDDDYWGEEDDDCFGYGYIEDEGGW